MFNFQIKEVDLSGANLDDQKAAIFSTCLHNIEVLNVSECELTAHGIMCIARAIGRRSKPVNDDEVLNCCQMFQQSLTNKQMKFHTLKR